MSGFERNDKKLREMILYVASRASDDSTMGATKLNKVLFHAETRAVLRLRKPISGHPYMKREMGPAPRDLLPIRQNLLNAGRINVVEEGDEPYELTRIVALDEPDLTLFSAEELAILDEVIAEFRTMSGSDASEESHQLLGWRAVPMDAPIPYEAAVLSTYGAESEHRHARALAASLT